ncbi:hypothetical protein LCGC14_0345970 [marine sediment metagenome]|uniref:Terminase small subunit n=1 Tax=marine sediment metagenome TaxID=412755 RepID=A0A0F9TC68_9ZZZZ
MSNRITKEKAKTIANCFALNGFDNRVKTLIEVGYKPSYARCGLSSKIYDNILVKAEIKALQDAQSVKTELSIESQVRETKELLKNAKESNHHTAALTANDQLNRHIGFYNADTSAGMTLVDIMAVVGINVTESPQEAKTG